MKVEFWGVRGSIPTPLSAAAIRRRIAAVVMRIRPADLSSAESREASGDKARNTFSVSTWGT